MQIRCLFFRAFWNFWHITRLSITNHRWVINTQTGPVFLAHPVRWSFKSTSRTSLTMEMSSRMRPKWADRFVSSSVILCDTISLWVINSLASYWAYNTARTTQHCTTLYGYSPNNEQILASYLPQNGTDKAVARLMSFAQITCLLLCLSVCLRGAAWHHPVTAIPLAINI